MRERIGRNPLPNIQRILGTAPLASTDGPGRQGFFNGRLGLGRRNFEAGDPLGVMEGYFDRETQALGFDDLGLNLGQEGVAAKVEGLPPLLPRAIRIDPNRRRLVVALDELAMAMMSGMARMTHGRRVMSWRVAMFLEVAAVDALAAGEIATALGVPV